MLTIRPEKPEDKAAIRHINEEAFGRKEEAELIEKLRNRGMLTLSLVAIQDNKTVGHIALSPVKVESERSSFEAITLAPIAILPAYRRKGIGSRLIRASLKECQHLGHEAIVVLGHPNYHPRFGFIPAKSKGIKNANSKPLMKPGWF